MPSKKGIYMIILNPQKSNIKIAEFLKKYKEMINIPYIECPHCSSTEVIKWGTYTRKITYTNNSEIITETLKIQRIKCKKCNRAHALLPACFVPYKRNALDVILSTIKNEDISLNLSFDTLANWNKQFNKFLPYLKTLFTDASKYEIITLLKNNLFKYYKQFFKVTNKILMMIRTINVNMAHF